MNTRLKVEINPKPIKIDRPHGIDTYMDTIEYVGLEEVSRSGLKGRRNRPIVSSGEKPMDGVNYKHRTANGKNFWVQYSSKTEVKKKWLEDIADALDIEIRVEVAPK